jgi:hypothetical protein
MELNGVGMHRADGGVGLLGGYATLGYARRLQSGWSADVGLLRAQYSPDSSFARNTGYTELFAGLTGKTAAFRLALSPDYLWNNTVTIYGSGDLFRRVTDHWRVAGHFGVLALVKGGPAVPISRLQYDWTAQLKREFGHVELGVALSGGGPDPDYFDGFEHSKTAFAATARWTF